MVPPSGCQGFRARARSRQGPSSATIHRQWWWPFHVQTHRSRSTQERGSSTGTSSASVRCPIHRIAHALHRRSNPRIPQCRGPSSRAALKERRTRFITFKPLPLHNRFRLSTQERRIGKDSRSVRAKPHSMRSDHAYYRRQRAPPRVQRLYYRLGLPPGEGSVFKVASEPHEILSSVCITPTT